MVNDVDPVMFVDILPRCKQLVSLEISLPSGGFIGFSTGLSILLPTLRSLEVTCYSVADNILRCITTPLLERLSIRYYNRDLDGLVLDIVMFQQRSSTTLSSLVFYPSILGNRGHDLTEKVVAVLSLFPTIRSLEIHPPFDVNSLMQAMTCTEGYHILSNLQELAMDGYPNYYHAKNKDCRLSGSRFKSMVLSRWWLDGGGSTPFRNGLFCLQKVTLRGFQVNDSAADITHVSALSGLVLDYTPVEG
ncbi:hypothetical protein BT96DRAFT_987896 [Gymnopus androsaceus JB14]|uniref:F-box domain-containing protein n=1 Tax=Gymnopus androsaceus JB14 TaxID=1447944 RepID=A0A6A4I5T2_9AGAR|nr:hypothetical protein BT96DRAFT_987896 [Gymnopus androsaceus JB14]